MKPERGALARVFLTRLVTASPPPPPWAARTTAPPNPPPPPPPPALLPRRRSSPSPPCSPPWTSPSPPPPPPPPLPPRPPRNPSPSHRNPPPTSTASTSPLRRRRRRRRRRRSPRTRNPPPPRSPPPDLGSVAPSGKEIRKREKRDLVAAHAAEAARHEALRDDRDAFSVVVGARSAALDDDGGGGEFDAASANVRDVVVENFSVSARGKELLKNASVRISHGRRYGLVGPNGKGKSTLLKLLAWRKIPVPRNIDVLLVEQEVAADDRPALDAVVSADLELVRLRQEAAALSDDKNTSSRGRGTTTRTTRTRTTTAASGWRRSTSGCSCWGDAAARDAVVQRGWRMRISLARALFMQPTLLLLDEPTNHLDLRAVLWLEEYLCQWKKTLVVVSHDRDFLNAVCNEIIHLHDLKLHVYRGNFDDFESGYEQKRKEMNKKFETYDKQMRAAKKSGSKAQQDKVKGQALSKAARDAAKTKGKGRAAAADDDDAPPPEVPKKWRDYSVEFHFPEPTELTPPLLQLIEVSFSYPSREDFRLSNVDVGIDMGTRVAIVGPNGAGKSTLLNLLAGDLVPAEGEVRRSQKLRIGRYSQHFVDLLTMEENPVQYLLRLHPDQEGISKTEAVRAKLGKFGLPSHNHLTLSQNYPASIDALAEALEEFTGGVVLVSHDSRLISRVCENEEKSEIWVVEDGTVRKYPGSFQDYKDDLLREIKAEVEE
uniref:ABC transporter domain-containing protein n=1 Tax=Ananas comosus var. bracteatus TaxID=296719 RepID=A0A6V7NEL9_ANACO|nr:unnamed protein product [Ananas comosus var. bracteatus]